MGDTHVGRSTWKITFVENLGTFESNIRNIGKKLQYLESELPQVVHSVDSKSEFQLWENFRRLSVEYNIVESAHDKIKSDYADFKLLSVDHRRKRSLLPFIGSISSLLFGTVSESELSSVVRNVNALGQGQKKIVHVLEENISMLNISRKAIIRNRDALNDVIQSVRQMKDVLNKVSGRAEKQVLELSQFISIYLRTNTAINQLRLAVKELGDHFQYLQLQLNMLSVGHLSPSVIVPKEFLKLLLEIKSKIPFPFRLPEDPESNLWHYYQHLKVATILHDNRILVFVRVPLVNINSRFDLFLIHNLPFPGEHSFHNMTAQYDLEANGFAVSADRQKYMLLSRKDLSRCSTTLNDHCSLDKPTFQFTANLHCVAALFATRRDLIDINCKVSVRPNAVLPMPIFLHHGLWAIATSRTFQATEICEKRSDPLSISPPLTFINLNASCHVTSQFFGIPLYHQFHSEASVSSPSQSSSYSLSLNFSEIPLWHPVQTKYSQLSNIQIPNKLEALPSIPMNSLLSELRDVNPPLVEVKSKFAYLFSLIPLCLVITGAVAVWHYCRRAKKPRSSVKTEPKVGSTAQSSISPRVSNVANIDTQEENGAKPNESTVEVDVETGCAHFWKGE